MNKRLFLFFALLLSLSATPVMAAPDLEIDTPAITAIKSSMRGNHAELKPHYESGAIGLTSNGGVAIRDANLVPLAQRQKVNSLIAAQNKDRAALYKEIAVANDHPEWEPQVRSTFAERWIGKAPAGWWYQNASGAWVQK